jgi:hypothetical protein
MRFLLTIYDDERRWASVDEEAAKAEIDAYWALDNHATAAGVFVGSAGLYPTEAARTLRIRDDEQTVTDGPFAETKEQLGGFYLVECENLDEAIALAARIPDAATGCVEVRPVLDYEAIGAPDEQSARQGAAS